MVVDLDQAPACTVDEIPASRLDDLAQIIAAYNAVTEKLQRSHEALQAEVVRLQEELASADAQLQRSKQLAALGQMAAGIAHEVRNPLAAIQLYANMIVEDLNVRSGPTVHQTRKQAAANAEKIVCAVRGLDRIVQDVLNFARPLGPRKERLPAQDVVHRAVEAQIPDLNAAGISVRLDTEPTDLCIEADRDLLHQALLNLIRNAIEAVNESKADSMNSRVLELGIRSESNHVVLTVADSGGGIDDALIDRIFEPFFTTRNTGTGLGLAIVHRIVDAHRGSISVNNHPENGGTVFQLRLPSASSPVRRARSDEDRV